MDIGGGGNGAPLRRVARRVGEAAVIKEVVDQLKAIDRRTGIDRTLAIGELILNRFFGGDPAGWRDRRRNKNNSIRRLAEQDDCPFCRSALNEAVGVYVAVVGLPCVRTFGHVYASHVAAVLRLSVKEREHWLQEAEIKRWSVRELRNKIIELRRSEGERRGRPPVKLEMRSVSALRHLARQVDETISQIEAVPLPLGDLRIDLREIAAELGRSRTRLINLAESRSDGRSDDRSDDRADVRPARPGPEAAPRARTS